MTNHWPTRDLQLGVAGELEYRRKDLGLTVVELAERSGVHRSYIAMIERGDANPSLGIIEAIANAMNCRVGVVFTCGEYQE